MKLTTQERLHGSLGGLSLEQSLEMDNFFDSRRQEVSMTVNRRPDPDWLLHDCYAQSARLNWHR